jgi:hypothetical protein
MKGVEMTLADIIQDLHALEARLREYEAKYGVASADLYELYQQGLLDNHGLEQTREFTRWASAYEMKLEREAAFRKVSQRFISSLRAKAPSGTFHLTPNPELQKT